MFFYFYCSIFSAASPIQPDAVQHYRQAWSITPWTKNPKQPGTTHFRARSEEIHRFSMGKFMSSHLNFEFFANTSIYEDYEFCPCTKNKPTLHCQCEASVKGKFIFEQIGSNLKTQMANQEEKPHVTNLFWNYNRVNSGELYMSWGAFTSTFIGRPYFVIPGMVFEPLLLNSVFKCDIFKQYKLKLLDELPKDTFTFAPALRHTWLATKGDISAKDELNIERASLWFSFLQEHINEQNREFFHFMTDFRWIYTTYPPISMLQCGCSHREIAREFFPSLTATLQEQLDDLFCSMPKFDPRRAQNRIINNPNTYPLLGFEAPIQVYMYDKRQGDFLTPSLRNLILGIRMPAALFTTCQNSPLKHWKRMWQVLKNFNIYLWDVAQNNWCTMHSLPPVDSILQYSTGGFYVLEKRNTIEKALQYFRQEHPVHVQYERIRATRNEFSWYHMHANHLFFHESTDENLPTTPNLVNKEERLRNAHSLIPINNILTKQPPSDPNFIQLREDFHHFGPVERAQNGWPLENDDNNWEFCSRFFKPPTAQFSRYEVPNRNDTSSLGTFAAWFLLHLEPLQDLNNSDMQKLLQIIYDQIQSTAPVFRRQEAVELIKILKSNLRSKAIEPKKYKRAILSLITLLEKDPRTVHLFLFLMKFFRHGVVIANRKFSTKELGLEPWTKRKLEQSFQPSTKRIKTNEEKETLTNS